MADLTAAYSRLVADFAFREPHLDRAERDLLLRRLAFFIGVTEPSLSSMESSEAFEVWLDHHLRLKEKERDTRGCVAVLVLSLLILIKLGFS